MTIFKSKLFSLSAIDRRNFCVQIFFSDFSKGFDMIDHYTLVDELSLLSVDPVLSDWMKSYLTNRTAQAVCIDNTLSEWKNTYGGILQGTKMTL